MATVDTDIREIIRRIGAWAGGEEKALIWFRTEPLAAFGGRTAEALVREGKRDELREHLDRVALGGFA